MSINKLALIRYKTIDNCLQNRFRKWTLEDLIEACSEAIYEYEGITDGVSRRTVQLDIQNMRSEKLGYSAPIIVSDRKFYSYEDRNYSITNTPLTQQDLGTLNEVLGVLKQFKGFSYFEELNGMVTRLEDKLYKQQHKGKSYIDFEKNELLKGLKFIDPLHKSILNQQTLEICYQSFKARASQKIVFYPYLLKEYRNRWFLLGINRKGGATMVLALDRFESFEELPKEKYLKPPFDVHTYFNDSIGVSKAPGQRAQVIVLKAVPAHAPYLITKPLHPSQKVLKEESDGTLFSIEVCWNFELERELLGFGEFIEVLGPRRLADKIASRLKSSHDLYTLKSDQIEVVRKIGKRSRKPLDTENPFGGYSKGVSYQLFGYCLEQPGQRYPDDSTDNGILQAQAGNFYTRRLLTHARAALPFLFVH
jgi:predicted DNA-binding transcriptional regulator YafY